MNDDILQQSAYTGTKNFTQHNVSTANATGFGAATDDFMERGVDLNEILIINKPATYFFRVKTNAMEGSSIRVGDVLLVDRSIKLKTGKIIVAVIDGEFLVRRYEHYFNKAILSADNKRFKDITLDEFSTFQCWGVVTCAIHLLDNVLINNSIK